MQANLQFVMDRIFLSEGGYAEKPSEPGGAVMRGISFLVYQGWCASHDRPPPTFATLKAMPREEAEDIYEALYFAPVHFDQLQSGIDYSVVDFAINSGISAALTTVRRAVGFMSPATVPWRMGNDLLYALKNRPAEAAINQICDARWALMKSKPDFMFKSAGRAKRMNAVWQGSRELAGLPALPDRYAP